MSSEQDVLKTMPKQFHEKYLNGPPPTAVESLDGVGTFEGAYDILHAAVVAGETHMIGRLKNDTNHAKAYGIIMATLTDEMDKYLRGGAL